MKKMVKIIIFILLAFNVANNRLSAQEHTVSRPDEHAPIGVMGDHRHGKGEIMFSYRYMNMQMEDNRTGTNDISPETIATTVPNRFADMSMMPPTLRVVPLNMTMDMHMLGMMFAPSDRLTLMGMVSYIHKDMKHVTFQGGNGTKVLGTFTSSSSGFGDVKITALIKLADHLHINMGISIPTGPIEEEHDVLTPMDMSPVLRVPYPMQIGSGTLDLLPGVTYSNHSNNLGYGAQTGVTLRLGENKDNYRFGHQFHATAWGSCLIMSWMSASVRFQYEVTGKVEGMDNDIMAPVQTADPNRIGGRWLNGFLGINLIGQSGFVKNQRLAIEYGVPLHQDLNGPQLKTLSILTLGWQYAF